MRTIDKGSWPRRKHFEFFSQLDHPHFALCANVDLTDFRARVKENGFSFTVALVYTLTRVANAIPEFRYRIRGNEVVEHDLVHPSFTVLADEDDLFSFCTIDYREDFPAFADSAAEQIAHQRANPLIANEVGRDDLLYMTALPWVVFTGLMHPIHLNPPDSIPRIAWGKFFQESERVKMPLGVQAHHAVMDGLHMGRYYEQVQQAFQQPDFLLEKADDPGKLAVRG